MRPVLPHTYVSRNAREIPGRAFPSGIANNCRRSRRQFWHSHSVMARQPQHLAKRWVFTLNNPDTDFDDHWKEYLEESPDTQCSAWQHEIGENGTHHIQGVLILLQRYTLSRMKTILDRAHWEVMRGKPEQARDYCTKEETRAPGTSPFEWGDWNIARQGKRSDLQEIKRKLDEGATEELIAEEHFGSWCRYQRSFKEYKRLRTEPRNFKTEVEVVVGPTGTGKSTYANSHEDLYFKQNSNWWDGYNGQATVVLDDFYGWIKLDEMLRMMDRYPLLVQTKGGQTQFLSKKLILTSNALPKTWYGKIFSNSPTSLAAFNRRVDKWIYMGTQFSIATRSYDEFQLACDRHITE